MLVSIILEEMNVKNVSLRRIKYTEKLIVISETSRSENII